MIELNLKPTRDGKGYSGRTENGFSVSVRHLDNGQFWWAVYDSGYQLSRGREDTRELAEEAIEIAIEEATGVLM